MTCTIVQADLGPLFTSVAADLATDMIEMATEIVLGPTDSQATAEASYKACGIDPCRQIKLLAQHLLTVTPGAGASTSSPVSSQRVGEVSVSYATASSGSSLWGGSPFGLTYQSRLAAYERCRARRRSFPFGVGPSGVQP